MHPMGDARRHYFLTLGAAQAAGVDLAQALREGVITRTEYAEVIARCRGCDAPDTCARWIEDVLEQHHAGEETPPAFCANAPLLAELSRI